MNISHRVRQDVAVEVRDGYLMLSGNRKKEMKEEKDNVYHEECRCRPPPNRRPGRFRSRTRCPPRPRH